MNPLKKRQKLDDEQLEKICKELDDLHEKVEALDKEEQEKVIQLSAEYNKLKKPHFQKRDELVAKIPDFWLTAFKNHPVLGSLLSEEDEEIFKYMTSMDVEEAEDVKSGFKISMHFKKNPFFTNSTLSKEYVYNEEGDLKINASQIHWKKGKGPTAQASPEKKGNKRTAPDSEALSFFAWFAEEEEDELAEEIKESFWPNIVGYYHNIVESMFDEDDDDDDEEEEEEGEEGDGDEEDD